MKTVRLLQALLALGLSTAALALPENPSVVHGQVQVQNLGTLLQVLQSSPQAIVNWNQFNIGNGEVVRFLQPGANAAILNRVTGLDPSTLNGLLQANGRVFLVNPNGILFGPQSMVDVGSFTASTLSMSDADFLSGRMTLTQDPTRPLTALVNRGEIRVAEGGFVVLVAPTLHQDGLIVANSGQIQLGATRQATLSLDGQGLVAFVVPDGFSPTFDNPQSQRDTVLMTNGQVNDLFRQVVSHPGVLEAGSFQDQQLRGGEGLLVHSGQSRTDGARGGQIRLDSSQATVLTPGSVLSSNGLEQGGSVLLLSRGTTVAGGNISASASQGRGGFAEVSGLHFALGGGVDVRGANGQHGEFLLDPGNLTIVQGAGPGSLDASLPTIVNATGGLNESVSTNQIAAVMGTVTLQATNNVTYPNATGINAPNTRVNISAGNDIAIDSPNSMTFNLQGLNLTAGRNVTISSVFDNTITASQGIEIQGADVRLTGRNVVINGGTGLRMAAGSGNVTVNTNTLNAGASGPVQLQSNAGDVQITSNSLTLSAPNLDISAGNDLQMGVSGTTSLSATNTSWSAGRDLRQSSNVLGQSSASNVSVRAGRDIQLQNGVVGVNRVAANATRDLTVLNPNAQGYTGDQGLDFVAGNRLSVNSTFQTSLNAGSGALRLQGQSVDLRGSNYALNGPTGITVQATGGNLSSNTAILEVVATGAPVRWVAPSGDVILSASGLVLGGPHVEVLAGNDLQMGVSGTTSLSSGNVSLRAGRDLSQGSNVLGQLSASNIAFTGGRDVRLQNNVVGLNRLTANATRDLTVVNPNSQGYTGNQGLDFVAGNRLSVNSTFQTTLNAGSGALRLQGQSVDLRGTNYSLNGPTGITVQATGGNLSSNTAVLEVVASGAPVRWVAPSGDVILSATGLVLGGPHVEVLAGNDLQMGVSGTTSLSSGNVSLRAGRDLNQSSNLLTQSSASNVSMQAGRDATLNNRNVVLERLSVNATQDLSLLAPGASQNYLGNQGLQFVAGGRATVNSTFETTLNAGNGSLRVEGQSLSLSGRDFNFTGPTGITLLANSGNLTSDLNALTATSSSGPLRMTSPSANVRVNTNSLTLTSPNLEVLAGNDLQLAVTGTSRLSGANTSIRAGRDLNQSSNLLTQSSASNVSMQAGRDATLNNRDVVLERLSVNATQDLSLLAPGASQNYLGNQGLQFVAGGRATVNSTFETTLNAGNGSLRVEGQSLPMSGRDFNFSGPAGITVLANSGNLTADLSSLTATANSGPLRIVSPSGDVRVNANTLNLTSPNFEVLAGNDLQLAATGTSRLSAANTTIRAGRDLNQSSNLLTQSSASNVSMQAGRDATLNNRDVVLERLTVNATRDLSLLAPGASQNYLGNQGLQFVAGGRATVNSTFETTLNAGNGSLRVEGQSLPMSGRDFRFSGPTGITLLANSGNLTADLSSLTATASSGPLRIASPSADVRVNVNTLNLTSPNLEILARNDLQLAVTGNSRLSAANTTIRAGRDLNQSSNSLTQSSASNVSMQAGRDATLNNRDVVLERLTVNATRDLSLLAPGASQNYVGNQGLQLVAGGRATLNSTFETSLNAGNSSLRLEAQGITMSGRDYNFSGPTGITVLANSGNLTADLSSLTATASLGPLRMASPNADLRVNANGLALTSPNLEVEAGNDLGLAVTGTTNLGAANTTIRAGRDLNQSSNAFSQSSPTQVSMQAGRDVALNNRNVGLQRLSVNATRDLTLLAPGASQIYDASAGLALQAGGNLRSNSTFETSLTTTGNLSVSGTNVTLAGRGLSLNSGANASLRASQELNLANVSSFTLNAPGAVVEGDLSSNNALFDTGSQGLVLTSNGNLDATNTHLRSTGRISANATNNLVVNRVTSPVEVQLTGGNLSLASVGNLSGGNYTLSTPGNLTERVPVTNATAPTLGGLNISAGRIFGSGTNTSFSVPNTTSGIAQVAVTAGNDTALNASASMFQFGGVNISLQTTPQTGDIYVDGVLLFQGSPPPPPPDPPPPPPAPTPEIEPAVAPVNQTLTPDQRAELLAQSNLALGNLGSNSRVLEPEEQERVTVRHDGLRQTFPSNPISPTLELVLPAYTPVVGPGEWQELLSLYATVSDEMREKDRAAFNAMVDQEVREIWEIRYWRHLLEGLVLWGEVP